MNGRSLLNRALEDRQTVLWDLLHALQTDAVKLTEGFPAEKSERLMKACAFMGLEGVVMKRKGSIYRPGFRSPDWVKVPIHHREEFVVCGYLASAPSHLSSLILGQYDREGKLVYSGLVGTGLSDETRLVILRELQATQRKSCPFASVPGLRDHFGELRTDLSASLGTAHPGCGGGVPATAERRPTSRGPQRSQAGEEAGSDPQVSYERTWPKLTRAHAQPPAVLPSQPMSMTQLPTSHVAGTESTMSRRRTSVSS